MLIVLELNGNDAEALLHHCIDHHPNSGDFRHDSRLAEALETLATAVKNAMSGQALSNQPTDIIDSRLMEAAIRLFNEEVVAIQWLQRPLRALGQKRPIDVDVDTALDLIGRLEHGFGA